MAKKRRHSIFAKYIFVFLLMFALHNSVQASVVDELKEKISERNTEIEKLEKEIELYQEQVEEAGKEASTLQTTVKQLDATAKKLGTDIRITEQKAAATSLTIGKLELEIGDQQDRIKDNSSALSEVLRRIAELESRSLAEVMLSNESFSSAWSAVESLGRFQVGIRDHLKEIQKLKQENESQKASLEKERAKLLTLSSQLADQRFIVSENKIAKNRLLKETKNKESNYKSLLNDRLAKKEALEAEIQEFENRIRVEIDPSSLPETGTGVLRWPLDKVSITQYFGNTSFASKNPQVYNGGGHNGIDLRASVGTPVKAAKSGKIVGTGDTDRQCYGVSYGKWVLVEHDNNISTLYAHLSLIRVSSGDIVGSGDLLGYSGNTGYSTGPHLHFAVFASKAVRVTSEFKSKSCKGIFLTLPLSSRNGYLNPLSYLPSR